MKRIKKEIRKEEIFDLYVNKEFSMGKIGKLFSVDGKTIWNRLDNFGIPKRSRSEAQKLLKGEKSPIWKGGKYLHSTGYWIEKKPDHPNSYCTGYIKRCDLVAEKALGRYLKKLCKFPVDKNDEIVHHINGNKADDRNENLLICTQSYHMWLHSLNRKRDANGRLSRES